MKNMKSSKQDSGFGKFFYSASQNIAKFEDASKKAEKEAKRNTPAAMKFDMRLRKFQQIEETGGSLKPGKTTGDVSAKLRLFQQQQQSSDTSEEKVKGNVSGILSKFEQN